MSDTSKTPNPRHCSKCGQPIPAEAPQGLCPKCLLIQASIPTEGGRPQPTPSREEVAAAFPQLEILELIGQGGMGFVFKARQPKLERLVALKILSRTLADDPAFAERFTREGRVLARLSHPNIVAIHDFGQAGGFFYLLMEFVDGVNLRQAMRAGRFTPAQALAVVPKICEALQFAHNEGILHRDIKPENILVDTRGRVKIADFGIAKLVGETASAAALTGSGATLGTPHYMAPEQLEKPATVDHRADIYSLGVVFYEMLTGELPLGRFQPPSHKVEMDVRLDEVVLHALEKEPSRRYQQASQVKTAVETIAGAPPPPPLMPPPDRFWRRMALAMALLCLTLILVMAFFARPFLATQRAVTSSPAPSIPVGETDKESATLVIDTVKYASDDGDEKSNPLSLRWRFRCLIPANHLAQLVLVFWTNGVPTIKPNFSGYFKVGEKPLVVQDMMFSCGSPAPSLYGARNVVYWGANPGFYRTTGEWISNQPPYRKLEMAARSVLYSGRQLAIRLAEFVPPPGPVNSSWSGVEIRVILQPLQSPPVLTDPGDFDGTNYVAGFGLAGKSEDSVLKMIKELPCEQVAYAITAPPITSPAASVPSGGSEKESATLAIDSIPVEHPAHFVHNVGGRRVMAWDFKSPIPSEHLAKLVFVLWSNGVPTIRPDLSVYFKVGKKPIVAENTFTSIAPALMGPVDASHLVQWGVVHVILDFFGERTGLISNQPPYRKLDIAPKSVLHSGRQLAIRLVEFVQPAGSDNTNWSGAEIRVILQPFLSPPVLTDPTEFDGTNYVAGFGLAGMSEDSMLKLIKELPCEATASENNQRDTSRDIGIGRASRNLAELTKLEAALASLQSYYASSNRLADAQAAKSQMFELAAKIEALEKK